jgi:hypothetical protein
VTCLACREHAQREHLRLADQMDRLGRMPGTTLELDQLAQTVARHRAVARQFATLPGDADPS